MADPIPDILIVGAGPTGLTAAVELARRGIVADVIDKNEAASSFSRAVGIMPGSMTILAPSGVADALRAEAIVTSRVIIHQGAKPVAQLRMDRLPDPDMRLLCLAQDRTETILRQAFERFGGQVQYNSELTDMVNGEQNVVATINTKRVSYDYVIGADGVNSTVRQSLGLRYEGIDLPQDWSIADVDVEGWPDPKAFKAYFLPHGNAVIVVPLEATRFRIIGSSDDALAMLPVPMRVTNLRRSGTFRISVRQVERYQQGRVFLAGDAAHCHSPVGGRGMNLGIADAADLAERFSSGGLQGYHDARHPEGKKTLAFSERGRKIIMSDNEFKRGLILNAVRLVSRVPAVNRRIVETILSG